MPWRYFGLVKAWCQEAKADPEIDAHFGQPLIQASQELQQAAAFFMAEAPKNPDAALAGAHDFLHMTGHVCLGLMWGRMAAAARAALAAGAADPGFYEAKIATGRYYMARHLPLVTAHLRRIESGAAPVMALDAAAF
jgi:hypothetical protein